MAIKIEWGRLKFEFNKWCDSSKSRYNDWPAQWRKIQKLVNKEVNGKINWNKIKKDFDNWYVIGWPHWNEQWEKIKRLVNKEIEDMPEKIVAPKRVNSIVSGDAYFIGLAIIMHGMMTGKFTRGENIDPIYEELQRIGGFKIIDENQEQSTR